MKLGPYEADGGVDSRQVMSGVAVAARWTGLGWGCLMVGTVGTTEISGAVSVVLNTWV